MLFIIVWIHIKDTDFTYFMSNCFFERFILEFFRLKKEYAMLS